MASLDDFDLSGEFQATVVESDRITPETSKEEVRHIVLEVDKPDFQFKLGESVALLVPGPHEFGNPYHIRLYTIASGTQAANGAKAKIDICVRRCSYIDEFSGEEIPGVASNYLCDRKPGDKITLTGPYRGAFNMPEDDTSNILMFGIGTGIAPFRAFIKHIYDERGGWKGKVRLFYGAKTGLEMLYMNDANNDLANYYDQATFKAFEAVSPRPALDAPIALDEAVARNAEEIWDLVLASNTFVYVSGLRKAGELFDDAMGKLAGSKDKWLRRKAELSAGGRYAELLY